jgi:hypothetical protein
MKKVAHRKLLLLFVSPPPLQVGDDSLGGEAAGQHGAVERGGRAVVAAHVQPLPRGVEGLCHSQVGVHQIILNICTLLMGVIVGCVLTATMWLYFCISATGPRVTCDANGIRWRGDDKQRKNDSEVGICRFLSPLPATRSGAGRWGSAGWAARTECGTSSDAATPTPARSGRYTLHLKLQTLKPVFHFTGSRVESRRFQAWDQAVSSYG